MKDRKPAVFMIEVRGAPDKPRTLFNSHIHKAIETFSENVRVTHSCVMSVQYRIASATCAVVSSIKQVDLTLQADEIFFQKQIYLNANAGTHLRADDRLQRVLRPRLWPQH